MTSLFARQQAERAAHEAMGNQENPPTIETVWDFPVVLPYPNAETRISGLHQRYSMSSPPSNEFGQSERYNCIQGPSSAST